ncbi:SRPBCC family protein [Nocardia sp. CA-107356]|uniref:SRPBCC family protein n=1 Tax=Nocardia sp. CA-107356 TaxID=3239972 RepID=UPI003D921219
MVEPVRVPDLSSRPYGLEVQRAMAAPPPVLYRAWTERFDHWFAAPGSVLMRPAVNEPFFFETDYQGMRSPHYGRFLHLVPDQVVELTWVTGAGGTEGTETVLTVEFTPKDSGTRLRLAHAGFADEPTRDRHSQAWPLVLEQLDQRTAEPA